MQSCRKASIKGRNVEQMHWLSHISNLHGLNRARRHSTVITVERTEDTNREGQMNISRTAYLSLQMLLSQKLRLAVYSEQTEFLELFCGE